MAFIEIIKNTVLKPSPKMSNQISREEMVSINAGSKLPILAYAMEPDGIHFKVTLDPDKLNLKELHESGKNTWYVWRVAINDPAGYSDSNRPNDEAPKASTTGHPFTLPGFSTAFNSAQTIAGAPNFTWGEALHFDSRGNYRRPASQAIAENIMKVARTLEEVRAIVDRPIVITSWYRDPATNARIGGASQSRHMVGDAVDFDIPGADLRRIHDKLDQWWGGRGGLARGNRFIHIDTRGYRARWNYPGVR